MKKKEKVIIAVSIDKKLNNHINELFEKRSQYIEWLVFEDLIKNGKNVKNIML